MKEFLKKNWQIVTIGFATFLLAAIAVVTAWRLYEIGREPVAPTAPTSEPRAEELECNTYWYYDDENRVCQQQEFCGLYEYQGLMTFTTQEECQTSLSAADACALQFTITASPPPGCYEECEIGGEDCSGGYVCQDVDGTNLCVNSECPDEEDCICPSPSPSPSPSSGCYEECETNDDCQGDYICYNVDGVNLCVNEDCTDEEDCICPSPSPSPSPSASPSPSPSPSVSPSPSSLALASPQPSPSPTVELPSAGIISPTLLVTLGGILLIFIGLFL
jgi:hypothetical protein